MEDELIDKGLCRLHSKAQDVCTQLTNFATNQDGLTANLFPLAASLVEEYCRIGVLKKDKKNDKNGEQNDRIKKQYKKIKDDNKRDIVRQLKVCWDEASLECFGKAAAYLKQLKLFGDALHEKLAAQWRMALQMPMHGGASIGNLIADYLLQFPHVHILAALRSSGRNSLLKAYNIKISSYALGADFKLENEAYLSSLVGGDNEKFRAFCDEWFDYLFRNAELEFSQYDSKTWSLYRKEESRYVMNGYASRYPRWIQPEKNPSPGSDPIVMWERRGKTKFHQLLDKHKVNYGNQLRLLANEMFRVMLDKGVIIEDQESVGGGVRKNYALNLADVRLRLEEKPEADKESESEKKDEFSIRVEEHTAQLSTYRGRLYQALFSQGKINVLSCSTTFEMGVDLGGLNCVFMANMPPATADYRQRAGRAGRRSGSASYVFTYLGSASHDRYYKEHPERLFFGAVKEPRLYLENPVFRARHLRAEALHMFLQSSGQDWKMCARFFGKLNDDGELDMQPDARPIVLSLPEWVRKQGDAVQEHCRKVAGKDPGYSVAADLCWQIVGEDSRLGCLDDIYAGSGFYLGDPDQDFKIRLLAGPHILVEKDKESYWSNPEWARYLAKLKENALSRDAGAVEHHMFTGTTDVLSQSQILPRYGFPVDVIELRGFSKYKFPFYTNSVVDLSRDRKLGIFEYSPEQMVLADKKCYTSERFVQFGKEEKTPQASDYERICERSADECYLLSPDDPAPETGMVKLAIVPDAFEYSCERVRKATSRDTSIPCKRRQLYAGTVGDGDVVPGTNMSVYYSREREIIFLNTRDSVQKALRGTLAAPYLMQRIRTEVILLSLAPECVLPDYLTRDGARCNNAWKSALHAILKAVTKVLAVDRRDVDGIISRLSQSNDKEDERLTYMVIYDNSTSGSGALFDLVKAEKDEERNRFVNEKFREILMEAWRICTGNCKCHEQEHGEYAPYNHIEYLQNKEYGIACREYASCYSCLRSYENRYDHAKLDAFDAAAIIKALLDSSFRDAEKGDGAQQG